MRTFTLYLPILVISLAGCTLPVWRGVVTDVTPQGKGALEVVRCDIQATFNVLDYTLTTGNCVTVHRASAQP
jgi:hypothetical protein